jgi:hypothetical protein
MSGPSWPGPRSRDGGIDELPLPRGPGRLFLCGKHAVGPDPEAALVRAGAPGGTIVCLNERYELDDRYPDYVAWIDRHRADRHPGGRAVCFPIPDLHAPSVERVEPFVAELRRRLDGGEHLLMHCAAGIGRTGTMAVALLLTYGTDLESALAIVGAHRPMAGPEVGSQRDLVNVLASRTTVSESPPAAPSEPLESD